MSPSSSPPQNANRSPCFGRRCSRRACRATSRTVAEPDPLSLIPGPFATESRCAPSSTTPLFRPGRSAITFAARAPVVATVRSIRTCTGPACARAASSDATSDETTITGIVESRKSVAESGAVRPGKPSLAISAAAAPAYLGEKSLLREGATAAAHQGHGAAREPLEVGGLATAGRRREVDRNDLGGDVPAARVAHRDEVRTALDSAVSRGATRWNTVGCVSRKYGNWNVLKRGR